MTIAPDVEHALRAVGRWCPVCQETRQPGEFCPPARRADGHERHSAPSPTPGATVRVEHDAALIDALAERARDEGSTVERLIERAFGWGPK